MKYAASRLSSVQPSASAWVSQAAQGARARGEDRISTAASEEVLDRAMDRISAAVARLTVPHEREAAS